MSERGSFTTGFIYNEEDYAIVRRVFEEAADGDFAAYIILAAPMMGRSERRIVQGYVSEGGPDDEAAIIETILRNKPMITADPIRFVVACDSGAVFSITKQTDGSVNTERLYRDWMLHEDGTRIITNTCQTSDVGTDKAVEAFIFEGLLDSVIRQAREIRSYQFSKKERLPNANFYQLRASVIDQEVKHDE